MSAQHLVDFAQAVRSARAEFEATPGLVKPWLAYYEAKQAAYDKLVASLPEVAHVEDFWRYVQNYPTVVWLPVIEREVLRIAGHTCSDCDTLIPVTHQFCNECKKERRRESSRLSQAKKREADKRPLCPKCGVCRLDQGERKCGECKRESRKIRNSTFYRGRKNINDMGFKTVTNPVLPSKAMSTL